MVPFMVLYSYGCFYNIPTQGRFTFYSYLTGLVFLAYCFYYLSWFIIMNFLPIRYMSNWQYHDTPVHQLYWFKPIGLTICRLYENTVANSIPAKVYFYQNDFFTVQIYSLFSLLLYIRILLLGCLACFQLWKDLRLSHICLLLHFSFFSSSYPLWLYSITIGHGYTHNQDYSDLFAVVTDFFLSYCYILN